MTVALMCDSAVYRVYSVFRSWLVFCYSIFRSFACSLDGEFDGHKHSCRFAMIYKYIKIRLDVT